MLEGHFYKRVIIHHAMFGVEMFTPWCSLKSFYIGIDEMLRLSNNRAAHAASGYGFMVHVHAMQRWTCLI
ncbi:hypothetical protein VNO77_03024 [Canavalia gladiata]|uniref:Uncharacterized protein n=1 Tax=Canavalia gladiata TaxID=3824 RepID=A0AAN9MW24_CANGL